MPSQLPSELTRRIEALEQHAAQRDLDFSSWLWLALLGVVLPAVLLLVGWWL